jgi:hypothetical protein
VTNQKKGAILLSTRYIEKTLKIYDSKRFQLGTKHLLLQQVGRIEGQNPSEAGRFPSKAPMSPNVMGRFLYGGV